MDKRKRYNVSEELVGVALELEELASECEQFGEMSLSRSFHASVDHGGSPIRPEVTEHRSSRNGRARPEYDSSHGRSHSYHAPPLREEQSHDANRQYAKDRRPGDPSCELRDDSRVSAGHVSVHAPHGDYSAVEEPRRHQISPTRNGRTHTAPAARRGSHAFSPRAREEDEREREAAARARGSWLSPGGTPPARREENSRYRTEGVYSSSPPRDGSSARLSPPCSPSSQWEVQGGSGLARPGQATARPEHEVQQLELEAQENEVLCGILQSNINSLKEELAQSRKATDAATAKQAMVAMEADRLSADLGAERSKMSATVSTQAALASELSAAREEIQQLHLRLRSAQSTAATVPELAVQLNSAHEQMARARAAAGDAHELSQGLASAREELQRTQNELEASKLTASAIPGITAQLSSTREELQRAQNELEASRATARTIQDMTAQHTTTQEQLRSTQEQLAQARVDLERARANTEDHATSTHQLKEEVEVTKHTLSALTAQLAATHEQLVQARADAQSARADAQVAAEMTQEAACTRELLQQTQQALEAREAELAVLTAQISSTESQLESARAAVGNTIRVSTSLTATREELRRARAEASEERASAHAHIASCAAELDAARGTVEQTAVLATDLMATRADLKAVEEALQNTRREHAEVLSELERAHEQVGTCHAALEAVREDAAVQRAGLEEEIAAAQAEVSSAAKMLVACTQNREASARENAALKSQIVLLTRECVLSTQKAQMLTAEVQELYVQTAQIEAQHLHGSPSLPSAEEASSGHSDRAVADVLTSELSNLRKEHANAMTELMRLEGIVTQDAALKTALTEERDVLRETLAELEKSVACGIESESPKAKQAIARIAAARVAELMEEVEAHKKALEDVTADYEARILYLEEQLRPEDHEIAMPRDITVVSASDEGDDQATRLHEYEKRNSDLETELEGMRHTVARLEESRNTMRSNHARELERVQAVCDSKVTATISRYEKLLQDYERCRGGTFKERCPAWRVRLRNGHLALGTPVYPPKSAREDWGDIPDDDDEETDPLAVVAETKLLLRQLESETGWLHRELQCKDGLVDRLHKRIADLEAQKSMSSRRKKARQAQLESVPDERRSVTPSPTQRSREKSPPWRPTSYVELPP